MKIHVGCLFFIALVACNGNKVSPTTKKTAVQNPNVVFVLVDDLGWSDLGYMGSEFYETPHIDTFSKQSVNFTNAYSSGSVCSPSRAAIMTGKHPSRLNITDWIPGSRPQDKVLIGPSITNNLPLEEETMAEVYKKEGYKTFFAGKWHLGDEGFFPEDQGFDINKGGHLKGSPPGGYYSPYKNPKLTDGAEDEYLTDRLTDEAIQFVQQSEEEDNFFLFLSYYTVHTPIQANKKHIKYFEDKLTKIQSATAERREEGEGYTRLDQYNPAYASMLYALDQNVARLVQCLKEQGRYDDTVIVFTSDNGGLSTLTKQYKNPAPTSVLPLRGGKGWLYEGGIRVPLLIKPSSYHQQNQESSSMILGHDLFPTLLSLTGHNSTSELDGLDQSDVVHFRSEPVRQDAYWHYPHYHGSAWKPGAAIRSGKYKLIEDYESGKTELYNLEEDIGESIDLSITQPRQKAILLDKLHAWQDSIGAKVPAKNTAYVPQTTN